MEVVLTQLLVSVRTAEEAVSVSGLPVAILDVKEPNRGALGAPDPLTLHRIVQVVSANQTMSFAAGELSQWLPPIREKTGNALAGRYGSLCQGFRFVKIGLAGMRDKADWQSDWKALFRYLPVGTSAVVVSYLDHEICNAPTPESLVNFAKNQENCSTILFDTFQKSKNLFAHVTASELAMLVGNANRAGLRSVVAGSVDRSCLANVLAAKPDFVGVRGSVCRGDRASQIDGRLVSELASSLQAATQN